MKHVKSQHQVERVIAQEMEREGKGLFTCHDVEVATSIMAAKLTPSLFLFALA